MPRLQVHYLPVEDRFLHVAYEVRYLARAGAGWRRFGKGGVEADRRRLARVLSEGSTLVQDSLLLHARNLIEFLILPATPGPKGSPSTDIVLADFGLGPVSKTRCEELLRYKQPLDVHLMHPTVWRDSSFRRAYKRADEGRARQRVDWNEHNERIVTRVLRVLEIVSRSRKPWGKPFRHLHASALGIFQSETRTWPPELASRDDVIEYLKRLGLP